MQIDIKYTSTKFYNKANIFWWFFYFKKFNYIKGFIIRIFGIYINVRENNATQKLIEIGKQKYGNKH